MSLAVAVIFEERFEIGKTVAVSTYEEAALIAEEWVKKLANRPITSEEQHCFAETNYLLSIIKPKAITHFGSSGMS